MKNFSRPVRDLLVAVGLAILFGFFAYWYDLGDAGIEWIMKHEPLELDELLLFAWAASLLTAWYAWRRYREARAETTERRRVDVALYETQRTLEQRIAERTDDLSKANVALQAEIAARATVEQNLRDSSEQLSVLLASLPVAPYRIALAEGKRLGYLSESVTRLTGFPSESFMSQPSFWPDHVHPEDVPTAMAAYGRLVAEGTCSSEYRFRVADGGYRWFEDLAQMVRSPDGKSNYIVGVLIDIRERKRAEEAVRAQEDRFRLMVENSADMIMLLDTEGKLRYVSASHKRILGYDPDEVLGVDVFELIHPEDRPALQAGFARRTGFLGRLNVVRLRTLHKDGSWRVVEATAQNLFHVPAVAAIVINARDVTSRVLAEEALRASESRYRTLAEAAEEAIYIVDRKGEFLYVNNFMAARWGMAQEELIGQSLARLSDPDTVEKQSRELE